MHLEFLTWILGCSGSHAHTALCQLNYPPSPLKEILWPCTLGSVIGPTYNECSQIFPVLRFNNDHNSDWNCRDSPLVRNTTCLPEDPSLIPSTMRWLTTVCNSGDLTLLWPPWTPDTHSALTEMQANTNTHNIKFKNNVKALPPCI